MSWEDEARRLRERIKALEDEIDRLLHDAPAPATIRLFKTTHINAYPASMGVYFAVQAVDVTGSQAEGSTPTKTTDTPKILALGIGAHVPAEGSLVIGHQLGNIWAFRNDG